MIVVDTSVWIELIAGRESEHTFWLAQQLGRTTVGITDLILMEVLQGFREERVFQRILNQLTVWCEIPESSGKELAIQAAGNYRSLRAQGYTVRKSMDCLIATFCITYGHTLLHRDRDFDPFEQHLGLKVIHPARQ